jgi:SsrA-binding protein
MVEDYHSWKHIMASSDKTNSRIASNRKALHDYFVVEKFEAGVVLRGSEVKSIREGHVSLVGSYARIENDEVILHGVDIPPYSHGGHYNHVADRPRKLLLHRREIRKLRSSIERLGQTLIPLSMYFKRGNVKVDLGLCKGKQLHDKRETMRRKTADRDAARAMRRG